MILELQLRSKRASRLEGLGFMDMRVSRSCICVGAQWFGVHLGPVSGFGVESCWLHIGALIVTYALLGGGSL